MLFAKNRADLVAQHIASDLSLRSLIGYLVCLLLRCRGRRWAAGAPAFGRAGGLFGGLFGGPACGRAGEQFGGWGCGRSRRYAPHRVNRRPRRCALLRA